MMLDVLCVMDPRFAGGTASAVATDIGAMLDAGLSVGLCEVQSPYLAKDPGPRSKVMEKLIQDRRLHVFPAGSQQEIEANTVFLHHPMTFFYGLETKVRIKSDRAFLVAHHMPFRGDGSLQYEPVTTSHRVQRDTGLAPVWLPVSGLCRKHLQSFHPLIRLSPTDWPNLFDVTEWGLDREIFDSKTITIGRHGRADPLKWPDSAAKIRASLPVLQDTQIAVMGCPKDRLLALGVELSDWTLLDFDQEPVPAFLNRLDVFVYHFHPDWSETFGRTVAEAMLSGCVCVLDPRIKATFGDLAIYCEPEETAAVIEKLRRNPKEARALARRARDAIAKRHDIRSIMDRLAALTSGRGEIAPASPAFASPVTVLRKTIGMMRRREYLRSDLGVGR